MGAVMPGVARSGRVDAGPPPRGSLFFLSSPQGYKSCIVSRLVSLSLLHPQSFLPVRYIAVTFSSFFLQAKIQSFYRLEHCLSLHFIPFDLDLNYFDTIRSYLDRL